MLKMNEKIKYTLGILLITALALGIMAAAPTAAQDKAKSNKKEKVDPKTKAEKLVKKAEALMSEGDDNKAAVLLNKAISIYPKNEDAWIMKAEIYLRKDKAAYAMGTYKKALKRMPKSPTLWFSYGYTLGRMGKHNWSLKCFNNAIKYAPEFADAHKYKGYALVKGERFADAIPCFQRCLEITPDDHEARLFLGLSILENGNEAAGKKIIGDALAKKPELKSKLSPALVQMLGI